MIGQTPDFVYYFLLLDLQSREFSFSLKYLHYLSAPKFQITRNYYYYYYLNSSND